MLTTTQATSFLLAAVLITATPGPDNLMVLSMGVSRGRMAGMAFGLGCAIGCLSHTLLAVLGIGAMLLASPWAFTALKWVGGLYLVALGVQMWRNHSPSQLPLTTAGGGASSLALFGQGCLANAINPKVALFFLSFLPQFVQVQQGDTAQQLAALGLLFTAQAAGLFLLLGWFSGSIGLWLQQRPRVGSALDRVAGVVFFVLGLRMAISR
jgi:threonine/homoserine/homoserine lactone efflux protein